MKLYFRHEQETRPDFQGPQGKSAVPILDRQTDWQRLKMFFEQLSLHSRRGDFHEAETVESGRRLLRVQR